LRVNPEICIKADAKNPKDKNLIFEACDTKKRDEVSPRLAYDGYKYALAELILEIVPADVAHTVHCSRMAMLLEGLRTDDVRSLF
jgi:hypothetical protein